MNGNKKTFTENGYFYKEYSKNEFMFLKMLHGENNLHLDTITKNGIQYIEMPYNHVISIDTIKKEHRDNAGIKDIIYDNIPFILQQINLLNQLGIYYSDCLQWLLLDDNKLYLIDMDASFFTTINENFNNFHLLFNFFKLFNIDYSYITESLEYLDLFRNNSIYDEIDFYNRLYGQNKIEQYKHLNNPDMQKNHIYYCKNQRHIQLVDIGKYIHIYGKNGNMVITEILLNPEVVKTWELVKIA